MLNIISNYWIEAISPSNEVLITFTIPPLPPGTNVYTTISLSHIDTAAFGPAFTGNNDATFIADALIDHWTVYEKGGKQSGPIYGTYSGDPTKNAVWIDNCATITFWVSAERAEVIAQVSIFSR
jgi:hypothetical protein